MYKHLILASILMFAFVSGPSFVSAQDMIQDDTLNQVPADEDFVQNGGTTNTQIPADENLATENRNDGLNWMWLLPLLAIPIVYLLTRNKKDDDRTSYQDRNMVGSKGGRTNRDEDIDGF